MNQALLITSSAVYAFLGSIIPVMIWLWFWLKEDPHPEPRKVLTTTFFAGALAVPFALVSEIAVAEGGRLAGIQPDTLPFVLLFLWAAIEEYVKYTAARWTALSKTGFDEPIDAPIYLVTAALGFAAFENGIFLFRAFMENTALGVTTGQLRFLGATLLHVTTSGILGISIAYAFFHRESYARNVIGGFFLATLLHSFFNFFILRQGSDKIFYMFGAIWLIVLVIIVLLEKIKRLRPT